MGFPKKFTLCEFFLFFYRPLFLSFFFSANVTFFREVFSTTFCLNFLLVSYSFLIINNISSIIDLYIELFRPGKFRSVKPTFSDFQIRVVFADQNSTRSVIYRVVPQNSGRILNRCANHG